MNSLFSIFFGWSKASKCKTVIKRLQCRIKLLKNKRNLMIRQSREDILRLLENGQNQRAFDRAEKLYEDQGTVDVYELLGNFCEFIMINLAYIWQSRDFRNDINEAASSFMYASARCGGDLPELLKLRKLFGDRYGNKFEIAAVELLPGNLVSPPLIKKLSAKSVSDDVKFRLMKEIAKENGYAFYYDDSRHGGTSFLLNNNPEISPEGLRFLEMEDDFQENYASSGESCIWETNPSKNKNLQRAMTLPPPQKQKETPTDQFIRSVSLQSHQRHSTSNTSSSSSCSHVHPKLPKYDDLEARFVAIKRERSRSSTSSSSPCSHIHPKLPEYYVLEAKFVAIKREHSRSGTSHS
ncbi:hypothetical protein MKW98_013985 [Papaver atlanticum]|uniref:Uncharacterized protein n=1 Tax=Papaver atlanticum TaxID=357466 RepID=A0AAD4SJP2_9MAGN|nr:hypothetical protein MKW98_013985 [Papaver atlanticum]